MKTRSYLLLLPLFGLLLTACSGDDGPGGGDTGSPELQAVNGFYYKGTFGSSTTDHPLDFRLVDGSGNPMAGRWVIFGVAVGDGSLASDSVQTDAAGLARAEYSFDGDLGHAELVALARSIDTLLVDIRADVVINGFQGWFVLLTDRWSDIYDYFGAPDVVENPAQIPTITVANYEQTIGLVVILTRSADNQLDPDDTNQVFQITLTSQYQGSTPLGIGIGSTFPQAFSEFGPAVSIIDPLGEGDSSIYLIEYPDDGISFWGVRDTTIGLSPIIDQIDVYAPQTSKRFGNELAAHVRTELRSRRLAVVP